MLLELGLQEGKSELRADDRDVPPFAQQIRHAPDVVLVAVSEHDGHDVVEAIPDRGEIGQDHINAGLVLLREQHTAVHDQQLAGMLEDGHVPADFAQTTQGGHPQSTVGQGRGGFEFWVRMAHTLTLPEGLPG